MSKENISADTLTDSEVAFWEKVYLHALAIPYSFDKGSVKSADKDARKYADRAVRSRRKMFGVK